MSMEMNILIAFESLLDLKKENLGSQGGVL